MAARKGHDSPTAAPRSVRRASLPPVSGQLPSASRAPLVLASHATAAAPSSRRTPLLALGASLLTEVSSVCRPGPAPENTFP